MKILLVEDNESIVLGLEFLLRQEGFVCVTARSVREAEELLTREAPDLMILDVGLPDGDGFDLCRRIRSAGDFGPIRLPILFLTAREEERDVVKAFDLGADDYVSKPFRNRELVSRIKNVLRRSGKGSRILTCGKLKLDPETGRVTVEGKDISLTKLEYKILSILMNAPGRLFTREEILADIWDISGNFVNDNTLSVTIKRIREKIGDRDGTVIRTVRGMGYRLEKDGQATQGKVPSDVNAARAAE